jgi:iron complex outermembrane recepter protein
MRMFTKLKRKKLGACGAILSALCTTLVFGTTVGAQQAEARSVTYNLDIPSQSLNDALQALALSSQHKLLYSSELVDGKTSPAIKGRFTTEQAVKALLAGTKLSYEVTSDGLVLIRAAGESASSKSSTGGPISMATGPVGSSIHVAQADSSTSQSQSAADNQQGPKDEKDRSLESKDSKETQIQEVIVTGSHIHGVPQDSSQVIVYDRAAIEQSGAVTLEDFSRQMPENFSSVSTVNNISSGINGTGRNEGATNNYQGAGFNLHGLGAAATLTLINGHRIAAAGGNGEFVDISLIPVSAIERIEVLPDGASAIYGADAVAGVVNIILRSNYNGAETSVRASGATEGGDHQATVSQVLGRTWTGGDVLMAYEFNRQDGLRADQRDFIPINFGGGLGATLLYPEQTRNSVMLTGQEALGTGFSLSGDAMYSERRYTQDTIQPFASSSTTYQGTPKEYGVTLDLDHAFLKTWHADLSPSFYRTDQPVDLNLSDAGFVLTQSNSTRIDLAQIHVHADGAIASLPGGSVKAAVGSEFRRERLVYEEIDDGVPAPSASSDLARSIASEFAELQVPIVGQGNERTGLRRLEISLAGRYDHYSSGGGAATPRVGLLWSPNTDLVLHGSYAGAFVAPRLDQLQVLNPQYYALPLPDPTAASGSTDTLYRYGGNPSLQPERSKTFTFSADEKFSDIPGLSLTATYFNTVFKNQILVPPELNQSDILHDPTLQPYVNLSPNPVDIAQLFNSGQVVDYTGPPALGAAGVQATLDAREANVASSRQSGLDFSTAYSRDTVVGSMAASISGTYLIRYETQNTSTVPIAVLLNQLGEPVNIRANAVFSWSVQGLSTALSVHYVNHYDNPVFTPAESISSWTTADLHVAYEFAGRTDPILRGFALALDVRNLFDRVPPVINLPSNFLDFNLGFDGANADPLGRVITLQLRKRWGDK